MAKIGWIGIDVGGTKTRADLFDDDFHILKSIKFKTPKEPDEFQQNLTNAVKKLVKKADSRLLIPGIGVGFAGSVNTKKGVIESAPNLPDPHPTQSIRKADPGARLQRHPDQRQVTVTPRPHQSVRPVIRRRTG